MLSKKSKWLKILSSGLLLANLFASPIYAQEDAEETTSNSEDAMEENGVEHDTFIDLEAIGDSNPYSEDELIDLIAPTTEIDSSLLYEINDLIVFFPTLYEMMAMTYETEQALTIDDVINELGEPSKISEAGNSEFHSYIAVEDLTMLDLYIQYYDNGNGYELANISMTQTIPATFEEIDVTEDEVIAAIENTENPNALVDLLGAAYRVNYTLLSSGIAETVTWIDSGYVAREAEGNLTTNIREVVIRYSPDSDYAEYEIIFIEPVAEEELETNETEEEQSNEIEDNSSEN